MRVVEFRSPTPVAKNEKSNVLEILSPNWIQQQKAPPAPPPPSARPRRRAAVYLRYSTGGQDEFSFERQRRNAQKYADKMGAVIVAIFGDAGQSGAFTANRPGFRDMFAAADRQEFDLVIIEDGDRLSRKLSIMANAFSTLAERGIELHSSTLGLWSLMHCAFAGLMSDAQRSRIFELTRSGIIKILERNLWPGTAPFGYRKIPGQPGEMKKHRAEANVVRRIYKMRSKGLLPYQIYAILKKENAPSPNKKWRLKAVEYVLRNPIYAGALIFFRTKHQKIQKNPTTIVTKITKRSAAEWHYGERRDWALVDIDIWQKVQASHPVKKVRGPGPVYLLSRLIYCGGCARRMHIGGSHHGVSHFVCSTGWARKHNGLKSAPCKEPSVTVKILESAVIRLVSEKLNAPASLGLMQSAHSARLSIKSKELGAERSDLLKERVVISARLDATLDHAISAGLTTKFLSEQRAALCERLEQIDLRIAQLPRVSLSSVPLLDTPAAAASFLEALCSGEKLGGNEASARLVALFQALVEKIVVRTDMTTRKVHLEIKGPLAFADESGRAIATFDNQRRQGHLDRLSNANSSLSTNALSDSDWELIEARLGDDAIWVNGFDHPIRLRKVIDAMIFRRRLGVGMFSLPEAFGPNRQVRLAAQLLTYGGVLDRVETIVREQNIEIARGLSLNLDRYRSPDPDPMDAYLRRNAIRKARILSKARRQSGISAVA